MASRPTTDPVAPADDWAQRSPAERAAWIERMAAMAEPPQPPGSDDLWRVRTRAALSGWVKPLDLMVAMTVAKPHALLDSIATAFDRVRTEHGWRWQMRAGPRRSVLREMTERAGDGGLAGFISDAEQVPTDAPGKKLRAILGAPETTVRPGAARRGSLETALQALNWASIAADEGAVADEPVQRARGEVRRALATDISKQNYKRLRGPRLHGYTPELRSLRAFAARSFSGDRVPVLAVEGIGGAGKSTLLSELALGLLKPRRGAVSPLIVQLDFDRLSFRNGGELERSFEVLRQLGVLIPDADAPLAALRTIARARMIGAGDDPTRRAEQQRSVSESLLRDANALLSAKIGDRPVLLLLDTFEEWRRPSSDLPSPSLVELVGWLSALKDIAGLRTLRVVISGRVTLGQFASASIEQVATISLGGIDRTAANRLLVDMGVSVDEASRLLDVLDKGLSNPRWFPLTLVIAGRFLARADPEKRAKFLQDTDPFGGELDEALIQATLTWRFLDHMTGGEIREIALPALALRRITTPLIRDVLAPACGLGAIDDSRARNLFGQLAGEDWLVERDGDVLIHIPAIRSASLGQMAKNARLQAKVVAVHRSALDWYSDGAGKMDPTPDAARREALYHRFALLGPSDVLLQPLAPADDLLSLLPNADDFARDIAVQLRVALGETVSTADLAGAPASTSAALVESNFAKLVEDGDSTRAVRYYIDSGSEKREPALLAQAQVQAGRWNETLADDGGFVARFGTEPAQDALAYPLKYQILRAFLSRKPMHLETIAALLDAHAEIGIDRPQTARLSVVIDTSYYLLIAFGRDGLRERAPNLAKLLVRLARSSLAQRGSFDEWLRAAIVARALDLDEETAESLRDAQPFMIVKELLRPGPELLAKLRQHLATAGISGGADAVSAYAAHLDERPRTTTQLLVDWPSMAASSVIGTGGGAGAALTLPADADVVLMGYFELAPAIRTAIAGAFSSQRDFESLGELLAPLLTVVPDDLTPSSLGSEGWKRQAATIANLVSYLERVGATRPALEALCVARPEAGRLSVVRDGYAILDGAARGLLRTSLASG